IKHVRHLCRFILQSSDRVPEFTDFEKLPICPHGLVIGHKVYKIKRIYVALASIEKLKLWAAKAQAWARKNGEDGVELFITVPLGVEKVSYTKAFDEIMDEFDMVKISWFRDVPHL
ncbi:hypothetical protein, partial [Roseibacillus persicicus]